MPTNTTKWMEDIKRQYPETGMHIHRLWLAGQIGNTEMFSESLEFLLRRSNIQGIRDFLRTTIDDKKALP